MSGVGSRRCVVVGAGHAAAQLCVSLAQHAWDGRVTLIGDEPIVPYHRPPLSKVAIDPSVEAAPQLIRPPALYESERVELELGAAVRMIDRDARELEIGSRRVPYDCLVLATGSIHCRPPVRGIEHPRVLSLRTVADARALRAEVRAGRRATIIGGGFIGLEVAASLRKAGVDVTVLEMADRVLSRVTSPAVSEFFASLHRMHGVDLRTGVRVSAIEPCGPRLSLLNAGGEALCDADFVVLGAGARPNDDLARRAGLEVDNGIVVDARNQTSDPAIFAIGDCCSQLHPMYGARMRLESVQNACDQARTAAAALCGLPAPSPTLPWFWSDQYDVKLQIAGISTGYDQCVVRGDPVPGAAFSAWYLRQGRLIAVDAVNDPRAYVIGTRIIPRRATPDPAMLADVGSDLKQLL